MLQDVARISSQYSEHFSMWRIIYISEPYFLFPFHMFFYLAFIFFITFMFIYVRGKPIYFVFVLFVVICVLYFSYLFLFFSFQVGFIIYILLLFTHFSMWSHSSDLLSCLFQKKNDLWDFKRSQRNWPFQLRRVPLYPVNRYSEYERTSYFHWLLQRC